RRVRESALAVAVAERPDSRDARAELVVDHDVPPRVDRDSRLLEAQIVGIGTAADGEQHVRAVHSRRTVGTLEAGDDLFAAFGEADALRVHAHLDTLVLDDLPDRG